MKMNEIYVAILYHKLLYKPHLFGQIFGLKSGLRLIYETISFES